MNQYRPEKLFPPNQQQQPSNTIPERLPPELAEAILDKIALNTKLEGNHFPKNAVAIVGFYRFQIAKDEDPLCPIGNRRWKGARSEKVVKVFQSTAQQPDIPYTPRHDNSP
ncbi:unnamed protein product [Orchesella dallaii]|uniref:Uncharacterized protein n=1 Tax=Orchesella dallaii TaxID=48710 RepID=A0ABP1RGI3_9HEXA